LQKITADNMAVKKAADKEIAFINLQKGHPSFLG
jgi:hypothetical protein